MEDMKSFPKPRNEIDGLRTQIRDKLCVLNKYWNFQKQRLNWIIYFRFIFSDPEKIGAEISPCKVNKEVPTQFVSMDSQLVFLYKYKTKGFELGLPLLTLGCSTPFFEVWRVRIGNGLGTSENLKPMSDPESNNTHTICGSKMGETPHLVCYNPRYGTFGIRFPCACIQRIPQIWSVCGLQWFGVDANIQIKSNKL